MSVTEDRGEERVKEDVIEIRLSDITNFLKQNILKLLTGALIGLIIGSVYAFSKPNVYTSLVTVMPEIQAKGTGGLGSLGSLAGLAGINLDNIGGTSDAIRPDLYPNVVQSIPFAINLLKQPVYSQLLKANMSLQDFMDHTSNNGIVSQIVMLLTGNKDGPKDGDNLADPKNFSQAIQVTKEQDELIKLVQKCVSAVYDKKSGILTITATEPDPVVAAMVARLSLEYLTDYISTYRTEKSRKQVSFLSQQVREAKVRYQSTELLLSGYRDRNRNLFLNTAKIQEQRLESDYLLAQTVYNELSKQLEQAKIKVQEETPVFKILEPPTIPLRKSGPKRTLIIVGFAVAGTIIALGIMLTRQILNQRSVQNV